MLVSNIFIFTPTWGNDPIWRAYFSDGLKPQTRRFLLIFWFPILGDGPSLLLQVNDPHMDDPGSIVIDVIVIVMFIKPPLLSNFHCLFDLPQILRFRWLSTLEIPHVARLRAATVWPKSRRRCSRRPRGEGRQRDGTGAKDVPGS